MNILLRQEETRAQNQGNPWDPLRHLSKSPKLQPIILAILQQCSNGSDALDWGAIDCHAFVPQIKKIVYKLYDQGHSFCKNYRVNLGGVEIKEYVSKYSEDFNAQISFLDTVHKTTRELLEQVNADTENSLDYRNILNKFTPFLKTQTPRLEKEAIPKDAAPSVKNYMFFLRSSYLQTSSLTCEREPVRQVLEKFVTVFGLLSQYTKSSVL